MTGTECHINDSLNHKHLYVDSPVVKSLLFFFYNRGILPMMLLDIDASKGFRTHYSSHAIAEPVLLRKYFYDDSVEKILTNCQPNPLIIFEKTLLTQIAELYT